MWRDGPPAVETAQSLSARITELREEVSRLESARDELECEVARLDEQNRRATATRRRRDLDLHAHALARVGTFFYGPEQGEMIWSAQLYRIYGIDPGAHPPQGDDHRAFFVDKKEWSKLGQLLTRACEAGFPQETIYRIRRADGKKRALWTVVQWVNHPSSSEPWLVGVVRDVTERHRTMGLLRKQRDLAIALSESSDFEQAASHCLRSALEISGLEFGMVYVIDGRAGLLRKEVSANVPDELAAYLSSFDMDLPAIEHLMGGRPFYGRLADLPGAERSFEEVVLTAFSNVAVIPFQHEKMLRGFLCLGTTGDEEISGEQSHMIETVAGQMGGAFSRIMAEEARRESEERFAKAFRFSPDALTVTSWEESRVIDANEAFFAATGYERSEVFGRTLIDLGVWSAEGREEFLATLQKHGFVRDYRAMLRDKEKRKWFYSVSADTIELGGRRCILAVSRDITDRVLASRRLEESEKRYRLLAENASDIIWTTDSDMNLTYISPSIQTVTGYAPEELVGRDVFGLFFRDSTRQTVRDGLAAIMCSAQDGMSADKASVSLELELRVKTGHLVWTETNISAVRGEGGCFSGFVGVTRDITQRKHAEHKQLEQQEQLIQAQKMASLGILASGIAHEISNPNSVVLLSSQFFSRALEDVLTVLDDYAARHGDFAIGKLPYGEARGELGRVAKSVGDGALRIQKIIDSFKAFMKPKGGAVYGEVDLNDVLESSVIITNHLLKKSTDHLEIAYDPTAPKVWGDFQRLEIVVINLLTNAGRALTCKSQPIYASVRHDPEAGTVSVVVSDRGAGIPAEDLEHIMDPFFTTRREEGGIGLGLFLSYNIVKSHNGELKATSRVGEGSTFEMVLGEATGRGEGAEDGTEPEDGGEK